MTDKTDKEDPRTSMLRSTWKEACRVPLKDAAFHLWRFKTYFDELEFGTQQYIEVDAATEEAMHRKGVMGRINYEHDHAERGSTFDRLKRAHPNAKDDDVREAIKAAVKMMDDCEKYFDGNYTDFGRAIDGALAKAKRNNPGFLDDTWLHAGGWLVYVMK